MYDQEDLDKATYLQELGHFVHLDLLELAEKLYKKREENEKLRILQERD
jgi:hypothetical protein